MFTALMESVETGKIFEKRRLAVGKTQEQLAAEIDVSVKTIQNIEAGRTRAMRLGRRSAYAAAIQMSLDEVQELMSDDNAETLGRVPRLSPRTIRELEASRHGGPEPSPEAQAEFDAVEAWMKELRKSEARGMKGKGS